MYSKGSGVELRENAPESVEEEEEEGRRRLGSIVLGSLVIKVVPGSLGSKVLGTSLDLGWLGRLTRDLASLPGGGGAKELAGPSRATNWRWKRRISSPGEEGEGREGREYWHMERDLQKGRLLSFEFETILNNFFTSVQAPLTLLELFCIPLQGARAALKCS